MTWLGTVSGKRIDLLNPDPEQITLPDIAHGLSRMCRFNGQILGFYSVAEHSVNVANLVTKEQKLQALLHDASEAYICDVPTPLKRIIGPAYKEIENRLMAAIGSKFGVDLQNLPAGVKRADRVMLVTEHRALQVPALDWGPDYDDVHTVRFKPMNLTHDQMSVYYRGMVEALL